MTIQTAFQPGLIRCDSCSSAELEISLLTKSNDKNCAASCSNFVKPRVKFNEQVMVRTIDHINDFSDDEISNTWYEKAEYQMMKASIAATVRKMVLGEYKGDTNEHCARGLEFRTPAAAQSRKLRKLDCLVAVLDEQEAQFCENTYDPETLAQVYKNANRQSRVEAHLRGEFDAEEVLRLQSGRESLTKLASLPSSKIGENETSRPIRRSGKGLRNIFQKRSNKSK